MTSRYSKAIGGFIGTVVALGGALLSLGVLSGAASHDVAVILAALTPLAGALGAAVAPPNSITNQPVQQSTADLVKAAAAEWTAIHAAVTNAPAPVAAMGGTTLTTITGPSSLAFGPGTQTPMVPPADPPAAG